MLHLEDDCSQPKSETLGKGAWPKTEPSSCL